RIVLRQARRRHHGDFVDRFEVDQELGYVIFLRYPHDIAPAAAIVEEAVDRLRQERLGLVAAEVAKEFLEIAERSAELRRACRNRRKTGEDVGGDLAAVGRRGREGRGRNLVDGVV